MNRVEIKEEAKEKIKGKKWDILWPLIIISVLATIISGLFGDSVTINITDLKELTDIETFKDITASATSSTGSYIAVLICGLLNAGYIKYLLTFVRKGKFDTSTITNTIKEKWFGILVAEILSTVIISICALFLFVPGIIMGIAYTFVIYLVIDKDVAGNESLKQSREMMKGYKWNYFVFELSFIGWYLLVPFTLGILLVWLIPYQNIATILYYERLQKLQNKH